MQIINQPSLSWSHSNKLLLTQWQFPNESINALTSNSFSVMLTFLHEKSHPERLSGRALSSYWASYAHEAHCKHTHTHPFSLLFYHTHTHTEAENDPKSCSISISTDVNHCKWAWTPLKCSLTASLQHGHVQPHFSNISNNPMVLPLALI